MDIMEIEEALRKLPIIKAVERSFELSKGGERWLFPLNDRENEEEAECALTEIARLAGFDEVRPLIFHIAALIRKSNLSTRFPIFCGGFEVLGGSITCLKLYYSMIIYRSGEENAMPAKDNAISAMIVGDLLGVLGLADKEEDLRTAMANMEKNGCGVSFIGLNIEKDKPISMKIYFDKIQYKDN